MPVSLSTRSPLRGLCSSSSCRCPTTRPCLLAAAAAAVCVVAPLLLVSVRAALDTTLLLVWRYSYRGVHLSWSARQGSEARFEGSRASRPSDTGRARVIACVLSALFSSVLPSKGHTPRAHKPHSIQQSVHDTHIDILTREARHTTTTPAETNASRSGAAAAAARNTQHATAAAQRRTLASIVPHPPTSGSRRSRGRNSTRLERSRQ